MEQMWCYVDGPGNSTVVDSKLAVVNNNERLCELPLCKPRIIIVAIVDIVVGACGMFLIQSYVIPLCIFVITVFFFHI